MHKKIITSKWVVGLGVTGVMSLAILAVLVIGDLFTKSPVSFDSQRAFADVEYQVALGPRLPGSEAHSQALDWMIDNLAEAGWQSVTQETERMGHPIYNLIATRGKGDPWIIIGAHYDSRFVADADPNPANRGLPVPGANDGASGVAVLLELARILPKNLDKQVWLVFFDAEDQGNLPGWDWILGSRAFVDELNGQPDSVVIIDMIGDADLDLYWEKNSDPELTKEIWAIAAELGYDESFIPEYRHRILDDHIPFVEAGITAIDIIDFDYPYWHTIEDTPDKVSPNSLKAVGDTLQEWILRQ
jgi:glutaminyl-peptide cyclotransferase